MYELKTIGTQVSTKVFKAEFESELESIFNTAISIRDRIQSLTAKCVVEAQYDNDFTYLTRIYNKMMETKGFNSSRWLSYVKAIIVKANDDLKTGIKYSEENKQLVKVSKKAKLAYNLAGLEASNWYTFDMPKQSANKEKKVDISITRQADIIIEKAIKKGIPSDTVADIQAKLLEIQALMATIK